VTGNTVFKVGGVEQEENPFVAGDKVVAWISLRGGEMFVALLVIDRASWPSRGTRAARAVREPADRAGSSPASPRG
jgi:hypothetical protein